MMTECPRCGFAQPNDRYCANCGVDMDNYKPKPTPWFKKLLNNMVFQILLAVWAVAAMVFFIFQNQQKQFNEDLKLAEQLGQPEISEPAPKATSAATLNNVSTNVSTPKTSLNNTRSNKTAVDNEENNSELEKEYAEYDFDQPPPAKGQTENDGSTLKSISKSGLFESEETVRAIDSPTEIQVRFAEVSTQFLNTLVSQGEVLTDTGRFRVFSLAHQGPLSTLTERDPGSNFLGGGQTQSINAASIDFSFVTIDEGDDAGMTLQLKPKLENNQITVNIEGQLNLKYEDEGVSDPAPITGRYTFGSGRILVVAGLLPHEALRPRLVEAFSNTPLSVMASSEFKANTSELVVFIKPR